MLVRGLGDAVPQSGRGIEELDRFLRQRTEQVGFAPELAIEPSSSDGTPPWRSCVGIEALQVCSYPLEAAADGALDGTEGSAHPVCDLRVRTALQERHSYPRATGLVEALQRLRDQEPRCQVVDRSVVVRPVDGRRRPELDRSTRSPAATDALR